MISDFDDEYLKEMIHNPSEDNVRQALAEKLLAHRNSKPVAWISAGEYAILRRLKQHSAVEVGLFNAQRFSDDTPLFTSPRVPAGWKIVPVEPTEKMVIDGFESAPDESFSPHAEWEKYQQMSGCQQAAHRARLCYAAMLAAAPSPSESL
ncbi:hypothetical protein [Pantoea septica]|uniref:hypothetical protein n=1 Tax=Pantoea septica TaxID=472695 RepID=UPI003CFDF6B4